MPNPRTNCRSEGCTATATGGKGFCSRHYRKWKRGSMPKARFKTCRVDGCHKQMAARGRCAEHFARDYPGKTKAATEGAEAAAN